MATQNRPSSFRPLERVTDAPNPPEPGAIALRDPKTGKITWITNVVSDKADGITDADYDFNE
jgi:hypothetical protein